MRNLAEKVAYVLGKNNLSHFGELLYKAWMYKKNIQVTNVTIETYYEKAIKAGALGGKILGALQAKGGGFTFYIVKKKTKQRSERHSV